MLGSGRSGELGMQMVGGSGHFIHGIIPALAVRCNHGTFHLPQ